MDIEAHLIAVHRQQAVDMAAGLRQGGKTADGLGNQRAAECRADVGRHNAAPFLSGFKPHHAAKREVGHKGRVRRPDDRLPAGRSLPPSCPIEKVQQERCRRKNTAWHSGCSAAACLPVVIRAATPVCLIEGTKQD